MTPDDVKGALDEILDEVTVGFGEQKFSPVQYQSFTLGPLFMKTKVRPGETPEQAMERAYAALHATARKLWPGVRDDFLARVKDADRAARGGGR